MASRFLSFLAVCLSAGLSVPAAAELVPMPPPGDGVLLIGDSLMKAGVGPILKKTFAGRVTGAVENKAKSGSGLSRPDYFNWKEKAVELLDGGRFGTVVMFIGANDCQTVTDATGASHRFDTPGWRTEYAARVRDLTSVLCGEGRKVYWLGLPPMEKATFSQRIGKLDDFLSSTFHEPGSCVKYVPMRDVLAANGGQFAKRLRVNKRRVLVREPDGIHITQYGGMLVADALLRSLD